MNPLLHKSPELDGSSVVYVPGPNLEGPGFHSWEGHSFCLSVPLYCCTDLRFFGVVLTSQVLRILKLPRHHRFLKPVPLSENDGTLDQQLEACRSMPQHAAACRSMPQHAAASQNFLGDRWCLLPVQVVVLPGKKAPKNLNFQLHAFRKNDTRRKQSRTRQGGA